MNQKQENQDMGGGGVKYSNREFEQEKRMRENLSMWAVALAFFIMVALTVLLVETIKN